MKKFNITTSLIIILPIIFGFLAGTIGVALVGSGNIRLPFFGRVQFSDTDRDRQIVIEQPRLVTVEQDLQLKQVENDLLPTLINIYPIKKSANPLVQAYLPAEFLGQGFALTADGWAVSVESAINNLKGKYQAVGYQNKQYEFSDFVKDEATGVVFGKMNGANGLSVAHLGRSKELTLGQTVVVISGRQRLALAHIKKIGYDFSTSQDLVQSSEQLGKEIFLDAVLARADNGAAVANLKGEIVGLVNDGRVMPVDYFKGLVNSVLNKQKISRPVLGVDYLDLSHAEGLIEKGERGALVLGNPAKASAAFGLIKDGDVIKKVDDAELNYFQSLSELLIGYKTGDALDLLLWRGGKEETVAVTLK